VKEDGGVRDYPKPNANPKTTEAEQQRFSRLPKQRKEEAMIARFDHHPMLIFLALATVVCVLMVALTLFVTAQAVPSSGPSVDLNATPSHSEIVQTMLL
jgi:hypothetical protein